MSSQVAIDCILEGCPEDDVDEDEEDGSGEEEVEQDAAGPSAVRNSKITEIPHEEEISESEEDNSEDGENEEVVSSRVIFF